MIRSLGTAIDRTDVLVASLGSQHSFVIIQGGNLDKPLVVPYTVLLKAILDSIDLPAGSAAWGSIGAGTGVASQTDLITYLNNNYYPLLSNPAGYVTASSLATTLLGYVTTAALASALAGYVPTSRTLTINGVTFDLSADRSWTISGGSAAWGSIATGTGVGSQADLVAYLVANYYPLSGNPSGFITSAALTPYLTIVSAAATYVPLTRQITINGITQDLSANRSWTIGSSVPTIYIKKVYSLIGTYLTSTTYYNSLLYFASFFIGGGTGGTQIYNATTAAFSSTSTFTQALYNRIVNNGGTDEVYVISQAQTTIQRLTASTGVFIANTALTGVIVTAVSTRFCQFSSTKVFFGNSANFFVLDPATFITTSLTAHGLGNIPYVAVNNNVSSPQNGYVMMGGPNGIILINGSTNAIALAATTVSGNIGAVYDVQYDTTNDVWIVLTVISNALRIVYLKPATSTTFTVPVTIYGVSTMGGTFAGGAAIYGRLMLDEASDYLFLYANHRLTQITLATGDIIQSMPIQSVSPAATTNLFSSADIDLVNKRIFAASGLNTVAGVYNVNEIMYS